MKSTPGILLLIMLLRGCGSGTTSDAVDTSTLQDEAATMDQRERETPIKVYDIVSGGQQYTLSITQDKFPSEDQPHYGTLTLRVIKLHSNDTLLTKTVVGNGYYELEKPTEGVYWFPVINGGWGSGIEGELYELKLDPKISVRSLMRFYELTSWTTTENADSLLVCTGLWNLFWDGENMEEFESHFDVHRQQVKLFAIESDSLRLLTTDTTKFKYDLTENFDARNQFAEQEKSLMKKLKWTDFEERPIYPLDID